MRSERNPVYRDVQLLLSPENVSPVETTAPVLISRGAGTTGVEVAERVDTNPGLATHDPETFMILPVLVERVTSESQDRTFSKP